MTDTTIQSDADGRTNRDYLTGAATCPMQCGHNGRNRHRPRPCLGITRNDVINAMNTARRMEAAP